MVCYKTWLAPQVFDMVAIIISTKKLEKHQFLIKLRLTKLMDHIRKCERYYFLLSTNITARIKERTKEMCILTTLDTLHSVKVHKHISC